MMDSVSGALVGGLEYSPFGELVRRTGEWQKVPFRFQTKWALDAGPEEGNHWTIGLSDHNLRVYDPHGGGFLTRDPLGEEGGNNLGTCCVVDPKVMAK